MSNEAKSPQPATISACLDLELGGQVFDYVGGMLTDKEEAVFEEHLLICDKCYRITVALDWANDTLRAGLEKTELLESSSAIDTARPLVNHTNVPIGNDPVRSSPAIYLVVGGLSIISLLALGVLGYAKFSKFKRSLLSSVETASP